MRRVPDQAWYCPHCDPDHDHGSDGTVRGGGVADGDGDGGSEGTVGDDANGSGGHGKDESEDGKAGVAIGPHSAESRLTGRPTALALAVDSALRHKRTPRVRQSPTRFDPAVKASTWSSQPNNGAVFDGTDGTAQRSFGDQDESDLGGAVGYPHRGDKATAAGLRIARRRLAAAANDDNSIDFLLL